MVKIFDKKKRKFGPKNFLSQISSDILPKNFKTFFDRLAKIAKDIKKLRIAKSWPNFNYEFANCSTKFNKFKKNKIFKDFEKRDLDKLLNPQTQKYSGGQLYRYDNCFDQKPHFWPKNLF